MERSGNQSLVGQAASLSTQDILRLLSADLSRLFDERRDIMMRIATVKKTILGLSAIFGEGVVTSDLQAYLDRNRKRQFGFTRACRRVLMSSDRPLSAREVTERLRQECPDLLARHKDPVASATTILNRMVDYGEAQRVALANHRSAWRWTARRVESSTGVQPSDIDI